MEWQAASSSFPESATASVATSQTTSSTSYTDLTTSGPEITMTTGTKALVIVTARASGSSVGGNFNYMSYAVSGATTTSASDTVGFAATIDGNTGNGSTRASSASLATLTAGSNVFTAKYRAGNASSSATFADRSIFVMNLA